MGTGFLALPNNMKILGISGFLFLIINLPINYYAGDILHKAASSVERRLELGDSGDDEGVAPESGSGGSGRTSMSSTGVGDDYRSLRDAADGGKGMELPLASPRKNESLQDHDDNVHWNYDKDDNGDDPNADMVESDYNINIRQAQGQGQASDPNRRNHSHQHEGIATPHTFDLIGITYSLFDYFAPDRQQSTTLSTTTKLVTVIYFTNIFLLLGNYILVMSHAVAAMIGEDYICLPIAGIIASTLMFAISQLRTMAMLGRSVSVISLLSLAIVVIQCLVAIQSGKESFSYDDVENNRKVQDVDKASFWQSMAAQLAALSSIGFAVGSQKLLLNIRHEFKDRNESPKSLAVALGGYGGVYLLVCILAGSNPPSLLFDAVPPGFQRRVAGFFLWVHVAVSYAINSQALCSALERLKIHFGLASSHAARWALLTLMVATSSYFVANALPFFKDLVALIGALTSVPLTLLLPALHHRKLMNLPMFSMGMSFSKDVPSLLLVYFSVVFMTCGIIGCVRSIQLDWANHGPPFACH